MEACDYKIRFARIAAAGNKPQDWKEYIDIIKSRTQSWEEFRRNRIMAYMYYNAFKVISNTDKSLSHAQLVIDYAELKSQQDHNEAVKLLQYGRRNLSHFAIIHVASAELELKKGNKAKASAILQKAASIGAEPISSINIALHRLKEGKICLLSDTAYKENTDSSTSVSESSEELTSSHLTDLARKLKQTLPGCQSSTQEVQSDLDILSSVPELASAEVKKTLRQQFEDSSQNGSISQSSVYMRSPEPPTLLSRKYFDYTKDSGDHTNTRQSLTSYNSHTFVPETPQGQHLLADSDESSTAKKTLLRFHSTPDIRDPPSTALRGSAKVKVTPALKKLWDEEADDESVDKDVSGSMVDLFRSHPGSINEEYAEQTQEKTRPETPRHLSNTRYASESSLLSTYRPHILPSSSSSFGVSSDSNMQSVLQSHKLSDQPKEKSDDTSLRSEWPFQKMQSAGLLEAPRKLSYFTDSVNRDTNTVLQSVNPVNNSIRQPLSQDISNSRSVSEFSSLSANRLPISSSSLGVSSYSSVQSVLQNQKEYPNNRCCDQPKEKIEDNSQRSERPLQKLQQSAVQMEVPIKLSPSLSNSLSNDTNTLPRSVSLNTNTIVQSVNHDRNTISQSVNPVNNSVRQPLSQVTNIVPLNSDHSSNVKSSNQEIRVESTKELLAKQQEIIQQQHQLVQQLVQQQAVVNNRTFSVPDQQPVIASSIITPAKSQMMSDDKKTIFVNGKAYTIHNLVGRGGSAKVYQVCDTVSNTLRALKCVNLACASEFIVEGYKNEINLLKKLQHCDRVIKLFDHEYIESKKKLLVVLEYGETDLCKFISQNEKNRKIVHSITIRYFWFQMVTAVNAMHKEGVIHSDLKPANFILVSGDVKLIDFGIANSLQQDNTSIIKENIVGTPSYMSPEMLVAINDSQTESRPRLFKVGVRSDVWSLGCILYQMVYGHTPFQHIRQKLEAIVNPAFDIPFPHNDDPHLMDVLKKCLSRDIELRPTTDALLKHAYLQK